MFENILQVEQVLEEDPQVRCRMIVEGTVILKTIQHILRDDLKKESHARTLCHTS